MSGRLLPVLVLGDVAAGLAAYLALSDIAGLSRGISALAAVAYVAAGAPFIYAFMRRARWEERLLMEAKGLCKGVSTRGGGLQRDFYCLRFDKGVEALCVNATYSLVGLFKGRPSKPPSWLRRMPRDYTCFRPLRGRLTRTADGTAIFEGLLAAPGPGGSLALEGRVAISEIPRNRSLAGILDEMKSLVEAGERLE